MKKNLNLCLALANAESEEDVITILEEYEYWNNPTAWCYYGGHENNYSTIGNQQSKPAAALAEKIINSVDHVLIKECKLKNIDPEGPLAPQSISEAVEKFFDIRNGVLSHINSQTRSELGENILLVASGSKEAPCYAIIDKGEGQTPKKMPATFLTLANKSNKLRVPFVQGKFAMGSTGALRFCGQENLQLIISKKHPELAKKEKQQDNTAEKWGFTIVRRENPSEGRRSSVYKYLAPNNEILSFETESLPILPGKYPENTGTPMKYGSFVKLYDYEMKGLKTNILFDLYNRMSLLLPNIALPVRFYERRKGFKGHSFETTLAGLSVRLEDDKRDNLENGFPSSFEIVATGQHMGCNLFAFKKGSAEKYIRDEGIIFVINGQTHGHLTTDFFSRKRVAMGYLADSLLVSVDCSKIEGRMREDLFMNSRDRLCEIPFRNEIEDQLEDVLRQHAGLKELREKRRREEIQNKLEDSRPLAEVLDNVLKKSPALASLLCIGTKLQTPFNLTETGIKKEFNGKEFPTFFALKNKPKNKIVPKNRKLRIFYETDAANDYFKRDIYPGKFTLNAKGQEIENCTINLWNGIATLTVVIPDESKIGEKIGFNSNVTDETRIKPFIDEFEITVGEEQEETHSGVQGERVKPPAEKGEGRRTPSQLNLPNVIEVYKTEWDKHKFDEKSALKVLDAGENAGYDFYINMDNIYLLSEIKVNSSVEPKIIQAKYRYALVLVGLALLTEQNKNKEEAERNTPVEIEKISRLLAPILLPMITYLGELEG